MTQNNKPEWFEITDADEKPALRKVSKSLPVSAVLAVALILGVGTVVGQTQNESSASAISASSGQTPAAEGVPTTQATSEVKSAVANPTTAAIVAGTAATNKLANPSIAKLPTGGGDDEDDEDDDHKRGHDDEDDDEDDEGDDD
jgi:uncharacterized protein HemX